MTAGRPIESRSTAAWRRRFPGQFAAAGANAFVAGSAVFKGGTMEGRANISANSKCGRGRSRRNDLAERYRCAGLETP